MLIIDCHAHVTSPDEERYPLKAAPRLIPGGKGALEDLRAAATANGVTAVRAVHTVSSYDYDNRYLCDVARDNPDWVAGICTLEPDDPASPELLAQCVGEYGVRTLRSTPGDTRRTFDHDGVRALWKACAELGASVDIFLMRPEHVEGAEKLLREFPDLSVGFCHCMDLKPGPDYDHVLAEVLRLADYHNLIAKVDFISTGSEMGYPGDDLHNAALKIIDTYGPERCVWGSNFPNSLWTPGFTYAEHLRMFTEILPLSDKTRAQVLGETARRLWFPDLSEVPSCGN
jgi:L-fuconolactonase